jgi:hypothetical protein
MNISSRLHMGILFCAVACAGLFLAGCGNARPNISLKTDYQAVFLDNGQVFFGRLENAGSAYPLLRDVFYVQSSVNKETKQVKNVLMKRGSEGHGPDRMYINARHIVVIEPVSPDSKVAQLIKEAKTARPGRQENAR